jgi:hypothetical protein
MVGHYIHYKKQQNSDIDIPVQLLSVVLIDQAPLPFLMLGEGICKHGKVS